jgi:hypothetical protein
MESIDLLDKLERVERTLDIYKNVTEERIREIEINIPVERLRDIVTPVDGDLLLYRAYLLNVDQVNKLNNELGQIIEPNFNLYYYVLDSHGIYNW